MTNQFIGPEGDLERIFMTEYWLVDQWIGDQLWAWGANEFTTSNALAALGDNTTIDRSTPITTFAGGTNWKQVSAEGRFSAAIKTDGTLWTWGNNNTTPGVLGTNTITYACTPVTTFAGGTNWKQVSCGTGGIAAIKTDGTLWTWGVNNSGELGHNLQGTGSGKSTPVTTFAGGTDWKQVSRGGYVCAAIKTDGSLWIWGDNTNTNLGINAGLNGRCTPVTTFAGGNDWKQVSCGRHHVSAIKTDGTLWIWGRGLEGQLGTNDITSRSTPVTTFTGGTNWKQVSCGYKSTAAIKDDGTLWVWGDNPSGQLAINEGFTGSRRTTPVTTFAGGNDWKQISMGTNTAVAIKTDGTLWTWGSNASGGQLGINISGGTRSTPVTTFLGGTNWKQAVTSGSNCMAVTSGTDPVL